MLEKATLIYSWYASWYMYTVSFKRLISRNEWTRDLWRFKIIIFLSTFLRKRIPIIQVIRKRTVVSTSGTLDQFSLIGIRVPSVYSRGCCRAPLSNKTQRTVAGCQQLWCAIKKNLDSERDEKRFRHWFLRNRFVSFSRDLRERERVG